MKENELKKIVSKICNDYIDVVMDAIMEDNIKNFPYTLAVWHFIVELKEKDIFVEFNEIFDDSTIIKIDKEISSYLAR